jgi:hypothetical protein
MARIHTPLVVLYSTLYRDWDNPIAYESQVKLIKRLYNANSRHFCVGEKPIVAAHCWSEKLGRDSPDICPAPPAVFRSFNFAFTHSSQKDPTIYPGNPEYTLQSTQKALQLAEQMHLKLYQCPMPDLQPILRLRPDLVVNNVDWFPLFDHRALSGMYYKSMWNRMHRPTLKKHAPEAGDAVALTTKRALTAICDVPPKTYNNIYAAYKLRGYQQNFAEQYVFAIIDSVGVSVIHDDKISVGLLRANNHVDMLQ